MAIRLIASDIDGTLLDTRWRVPEANRLAVERAVASGVEVVLATGRRFDFARPVVDAFACPLTLILNSGAIVKTRGGVSLLRHLLPRDVAADVLAATREFRPAAAVVFDRPRAEQVIFERIDWERTYAQRNRPFIAEVDPLEACLTEDPIQIMFKGPVALMRRLIAVLEALPSRGRFAIAVTEYESRDFSLVDVIRARCSKGATVAEWATRQGVAREEVMAIGDNLNDVEMLEFAGQPVVMGNAVEALKARGWPVTASNDEGGFAAAVNRLVFGE
jgi:hypothetical protein